MTVGELKDLLKFYSNNDELAIELYETISGHYVDTTADIVFTKEDSCGPVLRIDVEAAKLSKLLTGDR